MEVDVAVQGEGTSLTTRRRMRAQRRPPLQVPRHSPRCIVQAREKYSINLQQRTRTFASLQCRKVFFLEPFVSRTLLLHHPSCTLLSSYLLVYTLFCSCFGVGVFSCRQRQQKLIRSYTTSDLATLHLQSTINQSCNENLEKNITSDLPTQSKQRIPIV